MGHLNLVYNINFELSAAAFLAILFVYLRVQYGAQSRTNKAFLRLILYVLIADLLDVISAVTISYWERIPLWINTVVNTMYLGVNAVLGFQFLCYSYVYVAKEKQRKKLISINRSIMLFNLLMLLMNMIDGCIFHMSETQGYVHGELYYIIYAIPFYFIACSTYIMLSSFDRLEHRQRNSVITYSVLAVMGPLIQMLFFPDVLLGMFTVSLGIMMMAFSLETPDYRKLLKTMEELEQTKKEAEEAREVALAANRAKARFLANMSHEIRTPINAVLGMNEMIIRESNEESIRSYATDIESSGRMLLSLINDILDFSKIESGRMEIVPVEYDVYKLINNCYYMICGRAREKNLELIFENDPDMPGYLYGDEIRIQQIVVNLLTNAVKYTDKGEVTLTLCCERIDSDSLLLKIAVKDTGSGIRKEDQARLFDSFKRIEEGKNRNVEGAGLGLAITKQLVELMDGSLQVESIYELGSVFSVSIPQKIVSDEPMGEFVARHVSDNIMNEKGQRKLWAPHGRILVVDDMAMNLKVITGLLRGSGLQVDTAGSGRECLEMIKNNVYHIIFMDHMMPEMDGIETLHQIQACKDNPNSQTAVIMLTANAIAGVKEEYLADGFCDYLSKPFRGSELEQMIIKYLPAKLLTQNIERIPVAKPEE